MPPKPDFPAGLNSSGIEQNGNLTPPTTVDNHLVMQAPGIITTEEDSPEEPFRATVKAYFARRDDNVSRGDLEANRMVLYIPNDQYSNAVYLRDLCEPIKFRYTDAFGNEFVFHAVFKDLFTPALGFAYPYPCDGVLKIVSEIHVVKRCAT